MLDHEEARQNAVEVEIISLRHQLNAAYRFLIEALRSRAELTKKFKAVKTDLVIERGLVAKLRSDIIALKHKVLTPVLGRQAAYA